jgi:hypothetical protein
VKRPHGGERYERVGECEVELGLFGFG